MANDAWQTPPEIITLAKEFFQGTIEFDPASNKQAQKVVKAREWCGLDHRSKGNRDGINYDWSPYATVWLNPPYSRGNIDPFVDKALTDAWACLMLTNASLDTGWAHKLLDDAICVCLTRGRISFIDPKTKKPAKGNNRGQAIWYLRGQHSIKDWNEYSDSIDRFHTVFGRIGHTLELGRFPLTSDIKKK